MAEFTEAGSFCAEAHGQEVSVIIRKRFCFPLLLGLVLGILAVPVQAAGWEDGPEGPRYYNSAGEVATSTWLKGEDGRERWVGRDGLMVTDSWVRDDGVWYYVDKDGVRLKNTWTELLPPKGEEEEEGKKYTYCFMLSGKRIEDSWQEKDGARYYFGPDGKMETGWILDNMYYTGEDGAALTGWQTLEGPDGKTALFYFNKRGKLYLPEGDRTYTVRKVNGKSYCFSEDGAAQTGWVNIADTADRKNEPITDYRYFDPDGIMRTGWYSLKPPADYDGTYRYDVNWFCFDSSGRPYAASGTKYTDKDLVRLKGKTYLFDRNGTPVSGIVEIADADSGRTGTFFFGTRRQCFLQTGKRRITGSDGKETVYYFRSSGEGMTGVHENMLYYRGRRQSAETGKKLYRIVTVPEEDGTPVNYLTDAEGRVRKHTKVKDKDGTIYETGSRGTVLRINGEDVQEGAVFEAPQTPDADPAIYR